MTSTTARRAVSGLLLAVALAAFPAIYARARINSSAGDRTDQMISGCGKMMNGGIGDRGMMSGSQADRGMMGGMMGGGMMGGEMMNGMMSGGERPNQQWRR